jgi:anti-anti-sigma factor
MLDLRAVKLPTAGGLGQLVALHKELRASGSQLVLCNVREEAYEVFRLTRLTELLDVRRAPVRTLPG